MNIDKHFTFKKGIITEIIAIIGKRHFVRRILKFVRKFAISSITFNVVFFLLKMPMTIIIYSGYTSANFYLFQIAFSLFFLNFSTSIFVHFFTNSLFRRELFILLRIRKPLDSAHQ